MNFEDLVKKANDGSVNYGTKLDDAGVNNWFKSASDVSNKAYDYLSKDGYKSGGGDIMDSIDENLSNATEVGHYLRANKDTISDYDELYQSYVKTITGLRRIKNSIQSTNRHFSQFDSEEEYNKLYSEYEAQQKVLNSEDFDKYYKLGTEVSNPTWDDTKAPLEIGGWKPFGDGKDVNNMVTFAEANKGKGISDSAQAFRGGSQSDELTQLVNEINTYMTDDQKKVYNYYIGKGDVEKANEYLMGLKDTFAQEAAKRMVEQADNNALEMVFSSIAGIVNFASGIGSIDNYIKGTEADPTTAIQYAQETMSSNNKGIWKVANDLTYTTGNMLPSILVGTVTGGIGGAATMGVSAVGNSYAEMRNLGYDEWQSRGYATLVGAAEATLQYVLGGISPLGSAKGGVLSKFTEKALGQVDNALARFAITLGSNMLDEGIEEATQSVLEPIFKSIFTGEAVDIDWGEVAYSALLGTLSAGALEGVPSAYHGAKATYQAGKVYGNNSSELVTEALEIDPNNAHAQRMQQRLDNGKNVSGYQINRLIDATDTTKVKSAVESKLTQLGEQGDISKLSDIITKKVTGEALTLSEKNILKNSTYGNRVVNTLNPENIQSGKYDTKWAESIGTRKLNAGAYNKSLYDLALEKAGVAVANQKASVTENPASKEIATESKFKASETGETIVKETGKAVSVEEIVSNDGGNLMVKLDSGETINAKDLAYATSGDALVYEMVANMGVDPKTATAFIKGYDPASGVKAQTYAIEMPLAYQYGKIGYEKGLNKLNLHPKLKNTAYVLGRDSVKNNGRTWSDTSRKTPETNKSKAAEDGIIYDGFELKEESLTDIQKASLAGIRTLAKMSPSLEIHITQSVVENGKKYVIVNGQKKLAANGVFKNGNEIYIDINAGKGAKGAMLYTASHEVVHFIAENSFEDFQALADFLFEHYGKNNAPVDSLIQREVNNLKAAYKNEGKKLPSKDTLYMKAYEEVVANAMSKMLADPKSYEKLAQLKSQNRSLWEKIGAAIKNLLDKLKSILGIYDGRTPDAVAAHYVEDFTADVYNKLQDLYIKGFVNAEANYQASIGARNLEDFVDAKNTEGESLFQYKAMEADEDTYREMLKKWGKMTDSQISNLFLTIDNAMELIKDNLEALDYAWEADIDDRAFSPVKPNSDKLYQVSLDFSTLCRKRILQQTVIAQLQEALNKPLSREEGIAIRDALIALQEEGRQIEVACALCYVESARMKSPEQIKRFIDNRETVIKEFFAGKSGGDIKAKIKKAEDDVREKMHKENPNGIKGKDGESMLDPRTAKLNQLPKKYADEIRSAKRSAKQAYVPTAEEQRIIAVAKDMTVSDFTSPEGLENLAKNYPSLFDAYTSYIRNATKSKGIENDTWWRAGDSMQIGDVLIANMNRENGLRSQSWSDFQVIHILDYIASTIELATRETKEQAYTKVPDYAELMGNTGVMINLSLIPTAKFNGTLDYDSVEGIDYKRALELRDKYHATVGTICIGVDNVQIKMLLGDVTIDYVIPYHKSGMSAAIRKLMHIPTWSQYEEYQSEKNLSRSDAEKQAKKYGVTLLAESDPNYHKGTSFSEWFDIKEAQQIAKIENANPSDQAKQKKYGVMYGGYMAMQNAANNYLKLCAERGISPKFSHEKADFTAEENYWKLLIDRKMVDNITGEVIEQQTIKPIFDEKQVMRILNDELDRYPKVKADQDYAIRKVTEGMLSGAIKGGMSAKDIAKVMQKPVDNVTTTNIIASAEGDSLYSVDENFYEEFDAWNQKDTNVLFTIGTTSDVLRSIGMKDQKIQLLSGTVLKKLNKHPELTVDIFRNIPELLERPIIVQFSDGIDPETNQAKYDSNITVLGELYADMMIDGKIQKKPVLVSLELLPMNQKQTKILDVSFVTSAYGHSKLQSYLNRNSILYIEPNKKRTNKWLSLNRLQLPLGENQYGSIRIISYVDGKVKVQNKKNMSPTEIALRKAGLIDDFGNLIEDSNTNEVHSIQDPDSVSTRSLLANALESVAQNDIERNKLAQYKSKIALIESEYEKLSKIQKQANDLRFTKGRSTAETKRLRALDFEANQIANRINTYDRQLLNLESTTALKNVLKREKELARRKEAQKNKEVLARYREKSAQTQKELLNRNAESRKKAIENRHKTNIRRKIRKLVKELNSLFKNGTKKRNIKEEMKDTVASTLALADVLFNDDIKNEDIVRLGVASVTVKESEYLNKYRDLLDVRDSLRDEIESIYANGVVRETVLEEVGKVQEKLNKVDGQIAFLNNKLSDLFQRERARLNKTTVDAIIDDLVKEYSKLKNSENGYIKNAYNEAMETRLGVLKESLQGAIAKDMDVYQLQELYDTFKAIEHMIRHSNSLFREGRTEDLMTYVSNVQGEIYEASTEQKDRRVVADTIVRTLNEFSWNNLRPVDAVERLGSQTFEKLFWDFVHAMGIGARDITEAGEVIASAREKFGYSKWNMELADTTFTTRDGLKFKPSLSDKLSIYAYSQRDQAEDHMVDGGFTYDTGRTYKATEDGKTYVRRKLSNTYRLSKENIQAIIDSLTNEQRGYVNAILPYLTDMGKKGNEVSMTLYGIELFGEKVYFPLQSSTDYLSSTTQTLGATPTMASLANSGFTKQTKPHASNPIVLRGFDDVVLEHIEKMSNYHALVIPIENLRRVFDNVGREMEGMPIATKSLIGSRFGVEAQKYFEQWLTDINGGMTPSGAKSILGKLFSRAKGTAVAANLSVVAQQYFSIIRAMELVSPKYFVPFLNSNAKKTDMKQYEELLKYAPIAIIKEMGGFDVGTRGRVKDYIGYKEARKDAKYIMKKADDVWMYGAGKMDKLGWVTIWKAVKAEIASEQKLKLGTDEFFEACRIRFTEVVTKTQVFDSVASRSGYMRSKHDSVKYATSFMGEPTAIAGRYFVSGLNFVRAIKSKDGAKIKSAALRFGRMASVIAVSNVLGKLAQSLVYGGRDEDEDEALLERWMRNFASALADDLKWYAPLNYLPFGRDIVSTIEGWDVERPDMTLIADMVKSVKKVFDGDLTFDDALGIVGSVGNFLGQPLKNVIREIKSAINVVGDIFDDIHPTDIGGAFVEGFTGEERSKTKMLYDSIMNGDTEKVKVIKATYKTDSAYTAALRQALTENDPRIAEAVMAHYNGDVKKRGSLTLEIEKEGNFSQNIVRGAINNEITRVGNKVKAALKAKETNAAEYKKAIKELREMYPKDFVEKMLKDTIVEEEEETSEENLISLYKIDDYYTSILNRDTGTANTIYKELLKEKLAEGYLQHEAEDLVASNFCNVVKKAYMDGDITSSKATSLIVSHGNKSESEAKTEIKKCDFELEHGFSWSERVRAYRLGKISENELVSAVMDIEGETMEVAEEYIRFLDLEIDNPYLDIEAADAKKYFEYAEPAGIDIDVYLDYKEKTKDLASDKDENGKSISGSKKAKIMAVINSLPITNKQKDALYYSNGWSANTIDEAPWH